MDNKQHKQDGLTAEEVREMVGKLIPKARTPHDFYMEWLRDCTLDYKTGNIAKGTEVYSYKEVVDQILIAAQAKKMSIGVLIKATLDTWISNTRKEVLEGYRKQIHAFDVVAGGLELERFVEACCGAGLHSYTIAVLKHFIWQVKRKFLGLGLEHHMMPVFVGKTLGGKSVAVSKFTAPLDLFASGCTLADFGDERAYDKFRQFYIQILDEMQKADKADIESIKKVITATYIEHRILGQNKQATFKQNSTFIGTSNDPISEIIKDKTSARRFWEVKCQDVLDWKVINSLNYELIWKSVDPLVASPIMSDVKAISAYQDKHLRYKDVYEQFVEDKLELVFIGVNEEAENVYNAYTQWAAVQGITVNITRKYILDSINRRLKHLYGSQFVSSQVGRSKTTKWNVKIV